MPHAFAYGPPPPSFPDAFASDHVLRLFYASRAASTFTRNDMMELLATAARHNETAGITGLLCYKNRVFAQILEGDEGKVIDLYLRIIRDPRHSESTLLSIALVSSRIFPNLRMGFLDDTPLGDESWSRILGLRGRGEPALQDTFRHLLEILEPPTR